MKRANDSRMWPLVSSKCFFSSLIVVYLIVNNTDLITSSPGNGFAICG